MSINDSFIFTGGGDGGIRQWPLETSSKSIILFQYFLVSFNNKLLGTITVTLCIFLKKLGFELFGLTLYMICLFILQFSDIQTKDTLLPADLQPVNESNEKDFPRIIKFIDASHLLVFTNNG